MKSMFQKHM